jgi:hypothetical protein
MGRFQNSVAAKFAAMKIKRLIYWLVPVGALLLGAIPGLIDHHWLKLSVRYMVAGNLSCALARGYAREYEEKHGRKPDIGELDKWASERFAADLERMKFDNQFIARWKD